MPTLNDSEKSEIVNPRANPTRAHGLVKHLFERFPNGRSLYLRLLNSEPEFRELCEEYEACQEAIERLKQSRQDDAMRAQYTELFAELKGELLGYLSGRTNGQSRLAK